MINKIKQNYEEILELVFKVSYLCLAFATFITYIYMSPLQPVLVKVTLVLGALTIFIRVINWKKYRKIPCLILMALFCLSFLLSTVMNRQYGMTDNLKWIMWTGIQFFGLYVCDPDRDEKKYKREFEIISHIFIIVTVIAAVASLIMLAKSYSAILYTVDGEIVITGFEWDRLWGVYTDPNYGAICSVIGIVLSLLYAIQKKGIRKCGYVIAIVLNYVYLVFSDSRTGEIALMVSCGIFLYFCGIKKFQNKKYLKSAFLVICVLLAAFMVGQTMKTQNIIYQKKAAAVREIKTKKQVEIKENQKSQPTEQKNIQENKKSQPTERQKNIQEDVSNGRLALWKSSIEIWMSSPVYGSGYSTLIQYAKEHVPDTYAVNNDVGEYTSMHNTFFCTLAFQGAIGAGLLILIALRILFYVIKAVLFEQDKRQPEVIAMVSCVGCIAVSMMFLLDGIYTNSASAVILWIFNGYLVQYAYQKKYNEENVL